MTHIEYTESRTNRMLIDYTPASIGMSNTTITNIILPIPGRFEYEVDGSHAACREYIHLSITLQIKINGSNAHEIDFEREATSQCTDTEDYAASVNVHEKWSSEWMTMGSSSFTAAVNTTFSEVHVTVRYANPDTIAFESMQMQNAMVYVIAAMISFCIPFFIIIPIYIITEEIKNKLLKRGI